MPYDGAVTAAVRVELLGMLINGRVDKICQPHKDQIEIDFRQPDDTHKVTFSIHHSYARVHLSTLNTSSGKDKVTADSSNYTHMLRRTLRGARLTSIDQPEFDRILRFSFETFDEYGNVSTALLIAEIMGRHSNLILVGPNGDILDSLRHVTDDQSRFREVLPGRHYLAPPAQNRLDPRTTTKDFFENLVLSGDEKKQISNSLLSNFNGLSPVLCRELAFRASISPQAPKSNLTPADAERLWTAFDELMSTAREDAFEPHEYFDEHGHLADFSAFPLTVYTSDYRVRRVSSISSAVDSYYSLRDSRERLEQGKADLRRLIKQNLDRCDKKLILQEEARVDAKNAEDIRIKGDIMMANLWQLKKGLQETTLPNLYSAEQEPIRLQLDPSLTPLENAQKYYKRYSKLRNSATAVEAQICRTMEEALYLGQVELAIDNAVTEGDLLEIREELTTVGYIKNGKRTRGKSAHTARAAAKQGKPGIGKGGTKTGVKSGSKALPKDGSVQPMRFTTVDGIEVLVGKNNRQNDIVTMRMANANDIWLHTKDIPGSHVILRTDGLSIDQLPHESLLEAARLAAAYSKAKFSANVPVDYCLRKHVRKPPGAKPGMVIYDTQRTLYVDPAVLPADVPSTTFES